MLGVAWQDMDKKPSDMELATMSALRTAIAMDSVKPMTVVGHAAILIPARLASTRLPRKLLLPVNGQPVLYWTWRAAMQVPGATVTVATGDDEIAQAVLSWGGNVYRSHREHASGTSRIAEAAKGLLLSDVDVVVNLQGDEPGMRPEYLASLVACVRESNDVDIATLACPMQPERFTDPAAVKVTTTVYARPAKALYFSRTPLPGAMQHIGVYAFRRTMLQAICDGPKGPLSELENLEQLAWMEAFWRISVVKVPEPTIGIDTAEDLERFRAT